MQPDNDHQNIGLDRLVVPEALQFEPTRIRTLAPFDDSEAWRELSAPLEVTESTLDRVKSIIATKPSYAAGYHLKVLLIESDKGLEAGEAEKFPTLAAKGIETKSDKQKAREDRGSDTALIVHIGYSAWCKKDYYGDKPWAKVGMVIKMIRYTGHAYEEPPGSGKRYALINDEDVLGYYPEVIE